MRPDWTFYSRPRAWLRKASDRTREGMSLVTDKMADFLSWAAGVFRTGEWWKAYGLFLGLLILTGAAVTRPYQLFFQANGTGAASRQLAAKAGDVISVLDFYANGSSGAFVDPTGVVESSAGIQAAINAIPAAGGTLLFPPGTYSITSQLTVSTSHAHLIGHGAKLVQSGTLQRGITILSTWVIIEGLWIYNTHGNTEYADAPAGSTNAIGIYVGPGADNSKVINNRVEQFGYASVRVSQSKYVAIDGNELIGIGATLPLTAGMNNNLGIEGYLSGIGYPGLMVTNNIIHDQAQGIYSGFDWQDIVIANNTIRDIQGQHGMYLGAAVDMAITGNTVNNTGQNGMKVQISSNTTLDAENITITGNAVNQAGGAGIYILPATPGLTPRFKNVSITGNVVRNTTGAGIAVDHANNWNISANVITGGTTFGILTGTENQNGRIFGNSITTTQQTGIYAQATSTTYLGYIENNILDGTCAAGSGAADLRAVIYMGSGRWIVGDNIILNDGSCGSDENMGASAIGILRRNYPGSKNNVNSGTTTAEGLTTNTTGSNGVTITPNLNTTTHLFETVPFATWTVGAPTNVNSEAFLIVTVSNTSGGALTTTWNANFHLAGAWVDPATGFNRSVWFRRNNNLYYEITRSAADVAN